MATKIILGLCVALLITGCLPGDPDTNLDWVETPYQIPTETHSIPQATETVTPYAPTPTRFPSDLPRADCTARATSSGEIFSAELGIKLGEVGVDGLVPIYLPIDGERCYIDPFENRYVLCADFEFVADGEYLC